MKTEIEAKLKVDSLEDIENKLHGLNAGSLEEQFHKDSFFDDQNRTLTHSDRCLRIRHLKTTGSEKAVLTYKGPRQKHQLKKRQEIEFELNDPTSFEQMLSALGYQNILTIEKKRRLFSLNDCEIALDKLPLLGTFVEIEGPDDQKIACVQNRLDLDGLPHITKSYAELISEELNRKGIEERIVSFKLYL